MQRSTNVRVIPHSIEAEKTVLGSILFDERCLPSLSFLKPEHFYRDTHQIIYQAMCDLAAKQEEVNHITMCDELEGRGKLEQIGGPFYLANLVDDVYNASEALYSARIVEKKARYRGLIDECAKIITQAYDEDESVFTAAQEQIFKVCQTQVGNPTVSHRQALNTYMEALDALHEQQSAGVFTGIPTGFKRLDDKLHGFRGAKFYVVAARPGDGKTALGMNFAHHAIKKGFRVLFFSIEMECAELMERFVSMESSVNSKYLRDVALDGEDERGVSDWERVVDGVARLQSTSGDLWIDDTSGNTIERMRARAMQMQAEVGVDFIIVDYLQLAEIEETNGRKAENRRLEVEKISRELKGMARRLNVPVLAMAQLNRNIESRAGRVPQLSDLREAGGIEQDCDVAMFISKDPNVPKDALEYDVKLIIEKNRNGERGTVDLHYIGAYTRFYPIMTIPEEAGND